MTQKNCYSADSVAVQRNHRSQFFPINICASYLRC